MRRWHPSVFQADTSPRRQAAQAIARLCGVSLQNFDERLVQWLCAQRQVKVIFALGMPGSEPDRSLRTLQQRVALDHGLVYLMPAAGGLLLERPQPVSFFSRDVMLLRVTRPSLLTGCAYAAPCSPWHAAG